MLTGWMMKKCCEKCQTLTLSRRKFCRTEYQTRARKTPKGKEEEMNQKEPVETNWHIQREEDSQVFESIEEFVHVNIIDMKGVHCIKNIKTLYQSVIREMGGDEFKACVRHFYQIFIFHHCFVQVDLRRILNFMTSSIALITHFV